MQRWVTSFKHLLHLFLEIHCPLCQRSTSQEFCQDCTRQLQRCQTNHFNWWKEPLPVFTWGIYGGTLKRAITALKYQNQPQLARPLGHWLAQTWLNSQFASQKLVVVPIPLHVNKQKQRGYNQAALLAENFCDLTGLQLQQLGLERIRETESQFGLSTLEREKNLRTAFQLGSGFRRQRPAESVLLLDDIFTTGATARSAVQTLRQSGIQVHGLAVLAITQRQPIDTRELKNRYAVYNERV